MTELTDVERRVARFPGVARVAVLGEIPTAYIVRSGERDVAAGDVLAYCRLHFAPDKVPARIAFVDELPR